MKKIIVTALISLCFLSCSPDSADKVNEPSQRAESSVEEGASQPAINKQTLENMTYEKGVAFIETDSQTHQIDVEIAESEMQQAYGLMYRTDVPENTGMIFLFSPPQEVNFWMKNTYVPLDIFFVDKNNTIITIAENTTPESIKRIPSNGPIATVLEMKAGEAVRLGIDVGDQLTWKRNTESNAE